MRKIVKVSVKSTLVAILLIVFLVVLVSAIKGIATHNYHASFTQIQMVSDSNLRDSSLIERGTLSQFVAGSILPFFLFFVGSSLNHVLFEKYGWSVERLGVLVNQTGMIFSGLLVYVFGSMAFSDNILVKVVFGVLSGWNIYLLFRLILGFVISSMKGNLTPERFNIISRSNDEKKARALFVKALQKEQQSKKE